MAVLVSDSFNRTNGALGTSDTGQAWQTSTANFVVSNNKGTVSVLDNTQFAYIDTGQSDITLTADFSSTGASYSDCPKFLFRATNFTNGYVVRWDGTNWTINKLVNGALTALGSYASAGPNSTNIVTVKVTCSGNTINLFLNGTSVLTVTDSTFAGTNHGWGTMRVQGLVDNFQVSNTSTGTTPVAGGGTLTGTGSLTATGSNNISGGASLTGSGSLSASGRNTISGSSAMTASGSLTASGSVAISGGSSLTATGSLIASGVVSILGGAIAGGATLTAVVRLTASGRVVTPKMIEYERRLAAARAGRRLTTVELIALQQLRKR